MKWKEGVRQSAQWESNKGEERKRCEMSGEVE